MKKMLPPLLMIFALLFACSQSPAPYNVYTSDITNFWEAYDSVQTTDDVELQQDYLQRLYVDRGTVGLKEFMELRGGTPERWQQFISRERKRFERIRPYTLSVLEQKGMIDESLEKFRKIYPDFREGDIFFTIGIGNSGGTVQDNHVLIGCEVMATDKPDWAVQIVMHEFVHTQQFNKTSGHLLAHSIHEGMADFISELTIDKKIAELYPGGHVAFSLANEDLLWKEFKRYIYANDPYEYHGWLYGSSGITLKGVNMRDLGYGMGYLICRSFYEQADDKQAAVKEMLNTHFTDENARAFLLKSGYVPEEDVEFVQNFEFAPVPIKDKDGNEIEKVQYGYAVEGDELVFTLKADAVPFEISSLSVAGGLNDWNPAAEGYQMQKEEDAYVLRLPLEDFEQGTKHYFKFVANGDQWMHPPIEAANMEADGSGNVNLYFIVE